MDQAANLRKLVENVRLKNSICVSSGKGGVGKSNISLNLSIVLAKKGYKVCIIDGDFSLSNLNILLGETYPNNLTDLIDLKVSSVDKIIFKTKYENLYILPGGSGVEKLARLDSTEMQSIINRLRDIESMFDYIVIDTAAGIHPTILKFIKSSSLNLLVMTPEPTSLSDAYALFKIAQNKSTFGVIINMAENIKDGNKFYKKFDLLTQKFLKTTVPLFGVINFDSSVKAGVREQVPVIENENSTFSIVINKIGNFILKKMEKNSEFFSYIIKE